MRVLVTGATGFLGRHVCKALESRGHKVRRFDRAAPGLYRLCHFDKLVHLAARVGGIGRNVAEPLQMLSENVAFDTSIVHLALERNAPIIGIGSVCMYPATAPLPLREDDIWNGYPEPTNGPYGIAKRVQLELLRAAHAQYGLPYTFLVLANLYGPSDHFDRDDAHVIPMLVKRAVDCRDSRGDFRIWGDGSPTRDFLYAEDAADAICRAVEAPATNCPVNVGTGAETSVNDAAHLILDAAWGYQPMRLVHIDDSKPQGQPRRVLDTTRAKELLGWTAATKIEDGIWQTVDWYLTHRESKPMIPVNN